MTILHISDTHGLHRQLTNLPEADIVVHSGDFSMHGTEEEVFDFINWLCDLPYKYKIFIAGNHDDILSGEEIEGLDENCYYLNGNSITIEGIKFYGIPLFLEDQLDGRLERMIEKIPEDTDILISHNAPLGIRDYSDGINYGNTNLLYKVNEVKPELHLFGHIHCQAGIDVINGITFSNGSIVSEGQIKYTPKAFQL